MPLRFSVWTVARICHFVVTPVNMSYKIFNIIYFHICMHYFSITERIGTCRGISIKLLIYRRQRGTLLSRYIATPAMEQIALALKCTLKKVVTPLYEAIKSIWIDFLCFQWAGIDMKCTFVCSPTKFDITLAELSLQCQVRSLESKTAANVVMSRNLPS